MMRSENGGWTVCVGFAEEGRASGRRVHREGQVLERSVRQSKLAGAEDSNPLQYLHGRLETYLYRVTAFDVSLVQC